MDCCHGCHHVAAGATAQTLDEMDFERGIWQAALDGDFQKVQRLLAKKGSEVDRRDNNQYTALHYAARNGHLNVCKILIQHGANVNALTGPGQTTPLHKACAAGHVEVVEFLLSKKANLELVDADGQTVLHKAAQYHHSNVYNLLLREANHLERVADNKGRFPHDSSS